MTGSTDTEKQKVMQCKTARVIICNILYNIVHNKICVILE